MVVRILGWILLLACLSARAQRFPPPSINFDEFFQRLTGLQQTDGNYEDIYENLYQLYQTPLDLNRASADDLRSVYLLSELQIAALLKHRTAFGPLLSLYELQAVPHFTPDTIRQLAAFVRVQPPVNLSSVRELFGRASTHFLLVRAEQVLEPSRGFRDERFLGTRQRLYTRYRLQNPQEYSLGFISEKDAGEPNWLDYSTFHAQIQNKGYLKNMVVGDYQASFGQGLILGAGYFVGKGGEAIYTTRRNAVGVRPYNSLLENGFFRGTASTFQWKNIEVTALFARNRRSATLTDEPVDFATADGGLASLFSSGLFRTESELAKKNVLTEQNLGGNLTYRLARGRVGVSFLNTQFSRTLRRADRLYNRFEFSGKTNTVVSTDASYTWQNVNFFGEAARSASGGWAGIGGWVAALSPKAEWAFSARRFDPSFHSFYGNAFGENARPINEHGLYNGLKILPRKGLVINLFYDKFSFPWLRYLVDAPSDGHEYLARISYQPTKKWVLYGQFRQEEKARNLPNATEPLAQLVAARRTASLLNFDYMPSRLLKLQSRVQYNRYVLNKVPANGVALWQDVELAGRRWQLRSRVAYFSAPDYDTRIYAYENDVLYAVSFPAYYGRGWRFYAVQRWAVSDAIDVWLRVARTQRTDGQPIGSGLDALGVPHRTDVKVQIRYQF